MSWLSDFYDRRIVNVNINIVAAGILALIPTAAAAHIAHVNFGIEPGWWLTTITFIADAISDVAVYYLLHYIANHMPRRRERAHVSAAYGDLPYLKDATLAQFERMCLSPLLYLIALGMQYFLTMYWGVSVLWATNVGFLSAIATTRVLHTAYMYRVERRALAASAKKPPEASSSGKFPPKTPA